MEKQSYSKKVAELLKLPQSLCRQCGQCCKIAIFKHGLTYEEINELILNPKTELSQVKGAKDFLSVFQPVSFEEAQKINYKFTVDILKKLNKSKDEVSFFSCRYVTDDNKCSIHNSRPDFCRHYPVCSKDGFFFDACGYREQAVKNWAEIEKILEYLNNNH